MENSYLPKGQNLLNTLRAMGIKDKTPKHRKIVAAWTNARMPESVKNAKSLVDRMVASTGAVESEVEAAVRSLVELPIEQIRALHAVIGSDDGLEIVERLASLLD